MGSSSRCCPGCGLELPLSGRVYAGYYHTSPECWSVYEEVLGTEFGNAPLFGRIHQLTVKLPAKPAGSIFLRRL